jgi:hypothetical protein
MWFYNMCPKSNNILWHNWERLTTKQPVTSSVKEWAKPTKDSFDKDNPVSPVIKPKRPPSRSRRQLWLIPVMTLLVWATGAGRVFHTRAELQLKHKLRRFRACNGMLDTKGANCGHFNKPRQKLTICFTLQPTIGLMPSVQWLTVDALRLAPIV